MRIPRSVIGFSLAVALTAGASGCAQPDVNPNVRFTGDPEGAIPTTEAVETTTTLAPTTTLFFDPSRDTSAGEGDSVEGSGVDADEADGAAADTADTADDATDATDDQDSTESE